MLPTPLFQIVETLGCCFLGFSLGWYVVGKWLERRPNDS